MEHILDVVNFCSSGTKVLLAQLKITQLTNGNILKVVLLRTSVEPFPLQRKKSRFTFSIVATKVGIKMNDRGEKLVF